MIVKGEILTIDYAGNTCEVRLPVFESAAGGDRAIARATISNTPGSYNGYKEGDVVLVAFENGQIQNPVVIGKLYLGAATESKEARGSVNCTTLVSENTNTLPLSTKLTNDTPNLITSQSAEAYKTVKDIINKKQDKLTAGTNITITYDAQNNTVISAAGGGGGASNLTNGIGSKSIQQNDGSVSFTNNYDSVGINIENYVNDIEGQIVVDSTNHTLTVTNGAFGESSALFGGKSLAHGKRALAEGTSTLAIGDYSHAEGNATVARATEAHTEGLLTVAYGIGSHAEGNGTVATGTFSHTEGTGTFTTGDYAHAEGDHTQATGEAAHAEGGTTIASGPYSHAEGSANTASGSSSHAEGLGTTASGNASHAEGQYTNTNGKYCAHVEGFGTVASSAYQTVVGSYNDYESDEDAIFIVGNGYVDGEAIIKHDAFQILNNGTIRLPNYNADRTTVSGYKTFMCVNGVLTCID